MKSRRGVKYLVGRTNVPWAMVPLKPKELSRPEDYDDKLSSKMKQHFTRATRSVGIQNRDDFEGTIDNRCAFNLSMSRCKSVFFLTIFYRRSCAFATTVDMSSGTTMRDMSPAAAAPASK